MINSSRNGAVFFGQFSIFAGSSDLLRFLSGGFTANPSLTPERRKSRFARSDLDPGSATARCVPPTRHLPRDDPMPALPTFHPAQPLSVI